MIVITIRNGLVGKWNEISDFCWELKARARGNEKNLSFTFRDVNISK